MTAIVQRGFWLGILTAAKSIWANGVTDNLFQSRILWWNRSVLLPTVTMIFLSCMMYVFTVYCPETHINAWAHIVTVKCQYDIMSMSHNKTLQVLVCYEVLVLWFVLYICIYRQETKTPAHIERCFGMVGWCKLEYCSCLWQVNTWTLCILFDTILISIHTW